MHHHLTISIATKDRSEVVDATLRKLHAFGLSKCALIICDDGSSPPFESSALELFPQAKLIRNDSPQGQAIGRNQIAETCETPYLLQLDDDSYPVVGDIEELLVFAESRNDWLALAIPFEEPARGRSFPHGISKGSACEVRAFVGCSTLIHVENFRKVGGYADWIGRTGEEEELSLRGIEQGLCCLMIDGLRIRHEVTDVGRDLAAIQRRSITNWTRIWIRSAPISYCILRLARLFFGSTLLGFRNRKLQPILAYWRAVLSLENWSARSVLKLKSIQTFNKKPHVLDFFN
ncbi:glycosyltransferase [Coraliomargarita algicola]|uniref:Glycosyltransferase n=1 Tax=Coraliomargarita algicola TaxID=3092156 RepID=A0ABZ0RIX3_9BACT|nr:glycosyltransferase [Coraliomargarita sp. J2-16]WPJ95008.1 glycosyltransferase [Coraliomargarita sp. J2-16]